MAVVQRSYQGPFNSVGSDIREMYGGGEKGQYYITYELQNRLNEVEDAVAHIKLDEQFLDTSQAWSSKFNQQALAQGKAGAHMAAEKAAGNMGTMKRYMQTDNVLDLQDNQIRELHQWATNTIDGINQDMNPYKQRSVDRIQEFCDYIGVTDRFNSYRNNVNRVSWEPQRMGFKWLDDRKPNSCNRSLNVGWRPATAFHQSGGTNWEGNQALRSQVRSAPPTRNFTTKQTTGTVPSLDVQHTGVRMQRPEIKASIQEQCGINTSFPGPTEYQTRYFRPPLDRPTRHFIINPTPNFGVYGRPLMRQEYIPKATEYQSRYEWPDGNRITKLPWVKN